MSHLVAVRAIPDCGAAGTPARLSVVRLFAGELKLVVTKGCDRPSALKLLNEGWRLFVHYAWYSVADRVLLYPWTPHWPTTIATKMPAGTSPKCKINRS